MTIQVEDRQFLKGPTENEKDEKIHDPILVVIATTHAEREQERVAKEMEAGMRVVAHTGVNRLLRYIHERNRLQVPIAIALVFFSVSSLFDFLPFGLPPVFTARAAALLGVGLAVTILEPKFEDLIHGLAWSEGSWVRRILSSK